MEKNRVRLTESQLHRVIKESVKKALNESWEDDGDIAMMICEFLASKGFDVDGVSGGFNRGETMDFPVGEGKECRVTVEYFDGDGRLC